MIYREYIQLSARYLVYKIEDKLCSQLIMTFFASLHNLLM